MADDALNASAWRLGRLVGTGLLPRPEAESRARSQARAHGLDPRVSARTITRALDAGATVPLVPLPPPPGQVRRCSIPLARAVGTLGALVLWHAHHLQERAEGDWFRASRASWAAAFPWVSCWTVIAELDKLQARGLLRCREQRRGGCIRLFWTVNYHHELAAHLHGPSVAIPLADLVRMHDDVDDTDAEFRAALLAIFGQLARRGSRADPGEPGTVRITAAELAPLLPPAAGTRPPALCTVRKAIRALLASGDLEPGPEDGRHQARSYRVTTPIHHRAQRAPHKDNPPLPQLLTPCASAGALSGTPNPQPQGAPNGGGPVPNGGCAVVGERGEQGKARQRPDHRQNRAGSRSVRMATAPGPERVPGLEGLGLNEIESAARAPSPHRAMLAGVLAVCGLAGEAMTDREMGAAGRAAKELLAQGATLDEVRVRAGRYARRYPAATLTPMALGKHWAALRLADGSKPREEWAPGPARELAASLAAALPSFGAPVAGQRWVRTRDREREARAEEESLEAERARQLAALSSQ